ncbi:MAG: UbiA family prenyltransferase [Candidatus Neomarinimicrobiota bacterium]|nr:UbiA family prenyltransferase [Candidatus Neomarinimicrobiota bacterium]
MKKLFAYITIIRPLNVILGGLTIVISSFIVKYNGPISFVIFAVLVVMFYTSGANTLNDYFDYKIDKINRPDRAISSGLVLRRHALIFSLFAFILGTLFALQLNKNSQLVSICISLPLIIGYNAKLKYFPLIGNIVVALILSLSFIYAGFIFDNIKPLIIPAVLAFSLTLIREIVKDMADIIGDKSVGLKTFPIIYGENKTIVLCTVLSALLGIGSFVPFITGYYNIFYGILLILTVEIPLAVVVILLLNKPNILTAKRSTKLLKFCTLGGLFSIYIGTI